MPVVAGASGGVGDIVATGVTGLLVPPGDAAAFAAALRQLLARSRRAARWARRRARKVLREHDLPAAAARLGVGAGAVSAGSGGMNGSVLFHVQYLLGIGHLQRSLRIAEALAAAASR